MGMGKYYCDYCEKEFQDNPAARKRHLQSSSHLRSKSLWYRSFHHHQPPPCHRFLNTGFCPFGDSCTYSHSLPSIPTTTPTTAAAANNNNNNNNNVVSGIAGVSLGNLPPSLRPPPEGGYPPLPFLDWG